MDILLECFYVIDFSITTTLRDSMENCHLYLERKTIAFDLCYEYLDDVHDMLKESFGFTVSENLDGSAYS